MGMYTRIPLVINAVTFGEFVQYGREHDGNIVNGMPWSFNYDGHPVSHENNECYCICDGGIGFHFTPKDMLITEGNKIYKCDRDTFYKEHCKITLHFQEGGLECTIK